MWLHSPAGIQVFVWQKIYSLLYMHEISSWDSGCPATLKTIHPHSLVEHYLPLCTSVKMSDAAVGDGFLSWKQIQHQQRTSRRADAALKMPQTAAIHWKESKHRSFCFWGIKKLLSISQTLRADVFLFLSWLRRGFEHCDSCLSWRSLSTARLLVTAEELPAKHSLSALSATAHKQDHLAIISSLSQIHTAKQHLSGKMGDSGRGGK